MTGFECVRWKTSDGSRKGSFGRIEVATGKRTVALRVPDWASDVPPDFFEELGPIKVRVTSVRQDGDSTTVDGDVLD